jgi:hypothetical protein
VRQCLESPARRRTPATIIGQRHLLYTISHVYRKPATEQAHQREGSGRLVRERPLQQKHGTVIGQASHLLGKAPCGGCMQVQRVVRRIAGDHRCVDAEFDRPIDPRAEAAIGFGESLAAVVEIREVSDADHGAPRPASAPSATSTLSQ